MCWSVGSFGWGAFLKAGFFCPDSGAGPPSISESLPALPHLGPRCLLEGVSIGEEDEKKLYGTGEERVWTGDGQEVTRFRGEIMACYQEAD